MPSAPYQPQTEEAPTQELAPLRHLKGLSKHRKIDFIKENLIYEDAHLSEMSVPELDYLLELWHHNMEIGVETPVGRKQYLNKDAMACVPTLQKAILLTILQDLGVRVEPKLTNPALVIKIREEVRDLEQKPLGFGLHKLVLHQDMPTQFQQYCEWAVTEVRDKPNGSSQGLKKLAAYFKLRSRFYENMTVSKTVQEPVYQTTPGKAPMPKKYDGSEMWHPTDEMQEQASGSMDQMPFIPKAFNPTPVRLAAPGSVPKAFTPPASARTAKSAGPQFFDVFSEVAPQEEHVQVENPRQPQWTGRPEDLEGFVQQARIYSAMQRSPQTPTRMSDASKRPVSTTPVMEAESW